MEGSKRLAAMAVVAAFRPGAAPAGPLVPADFQAAGSAQRPLVGPPASRDVRLTGNRQAAEDIIQNKEILRDDERDFAVRFTVPGSRRMYILGHRWLGGWVARGWWLVAGG